MKTFGIILLVIGLIMTVFTGFTMVTKKNVVDVGPLEINKEEKESEKKHNSLDSSRCEKRPNGSFY